VEIIPVPKEKLKTTIGMLKQQTDDLLDRIERLRRKEPGWLHNRFEAEEG